MKKINPCYFLFSFSIMSGCGFINGDIMDYQESAAYFKLHRMEMENIVKAAEICAPADDWGGAYVGLGKNNNYHCSNKNLNFDFRRAIDTLGVKNIEVFYNQKYTDIERISFVYFSEGFAGAGSAQMIDYIVVPGSDPLPKPIEKYKVLPLTSAPHHWLWKYDSR